MSDLRYFFQEALVWVSQHFNLHPDFECLAEHQATWPFNFFLTSSKHLATWQKNYFTKSKGWADTESGLQRAFLTYTMTRFQKNPTARLGSELLMCLIRF